MNPTEEPAIAYVLRQKWGAREAGLIVMVGLWSETGRWLGACDLPHYFDAYSKTIPTLYVTSNPHMIQPPAELHQLALPLPKGSRE